MSTIGSKPLPEKRRKAEAVRKEALEVARDLLIAKGPGAITLKAVGARLGMSHANLIHHFGSAELFQARLRVSMIEDITRQATLGLAAAPQGEPARDAAARSAAIVARTFDAYGAGGIGMLMAWSVLTGEKHQSDGLETTTGELVAVVERGLKGPKAGERARQMVSLVTLLAFADSLIGGSLAETVGVDREATRALTADVLEYLASKA